MSEGTYQKQEFRFDATGLGLSTPTDQLMAGEQFPVLVNVRQVQRGTLKQRPGLNASLSAPVNRTPWHSLKRLNDAQINDYTYVAGIGPGLSTGKSGLLIERDTGFSGDPLSMVPYRPPQAYNEWMAVADSAKMVKVKQDGTVRQLGIPTPTIPPQASLSLTRPLTAVIDNGNALAGWTGAPALNTRVNTTVAASGVRAAGFSSFLNTAGWFAVPLASLDNITVGTVLTDALADTVLVEEVNPASAAGVACTVTRVLGENGATVNVAGWMWITPSVNLPQLKLHAYVDIGGDFVAVIDVQEGPDGQMAFYCYADGGSVINAGDTITVLASVYGYCTYTAMSNPLTATGLLWSAVAAGTATNLVKPVAATDLASFSAGGRIVSEDDEMSLAIYLSSVSAISELKIEVDVNGGTYTKDYYTRSVAPDEFIAVTKNTITATDNRSVEDRRTMYDERRGGSSNTTGRRGSGDSAQERTYINQRSRDDTTWEGRVPPVPTDREGAPASRTSTGDAQWFKIRFKMSDFRRVGESPGKGLQAVVSYRLVVITNASTPVDIGLDDWMIIGGFEPDITDGTPYEYRYRWRDSTTGERSNWSPPSRGKVYPHRYHVTVSCTGPAITGVDKIDMQRRGGTVNEWRLIGSQAGATFYDVYSDNYALGVGMNPDALEGNTNAQPFTSARGPLNLTGCVVSGPLILKTGAFNLKLAQGTPIIANGVVSLVYQVISADVLETYDSCGQSASAVVEIAQQFITSQALPIIFGTLDGWSFALGDIYNPGRLYFFNYGTLGSTRGSYYIDVTDNSEALLNGCIYDGKAYVFTSERPYVISFSGDENIFRSEPITGVPGLYARWALTVGDAMYWLGKDGVYTFDGGQAINIARRDLLPLFSNEGQAGASTAFIAAPAMPQNASRVLASGASQISTLRLSYAHNKFLYFDYRDTNNNYRTLVLDRNIGEQGKWGWYHDVYAQGITLHYPDEGEGVRNIFACSAEAPTANAFVLGGAAKRDNGLAFTCQVRTLAQDGGDLRTDKMFGDGFLDLNPANGSVTPTFYFDNFATSVVGGAITGATRVQPATVIDFDNGVGKYARNIAIDLTWSVVNDTVDTVLYGWGFSVMGRPEETIKRATDYSDLGHWGPKELKGLSMEIDTKGAARDLVIEYTTESGAVATIAKTVTAAQKTIVHIAWDPVTAYEARIRPTDTDRWRFFEVVKWHYEPLSDLSTLVGDWHHFNTAVWVQGVEIDGDTNNAPVVTAIHRDFSESVRNITATHAGRGTKAYSFDPPFIAYMVRTVPSAPFRRMQERWIFKPEAPVGTIWQTQEFELGTPYGFARDLELEYAAGAAVTLKYYVDGTLVLTDAATLTTTGSTETYVKKIVDLPAIKGQLAYVRLECATGVRVRQNGSLLRVKAFGGGGFQRVPVVGGAHGYGAEV